MKEYKLSLREWLELGQAMTELSFVGPKWFRAWHTQEIRIGAGKIKADGKTYKIGRYILIEPFKYF